MNTSASKDQACNRSLATLGELESQMSDIRRHLPCLMNTGELLSILLMHNNLMCYEESMATDFVESTMGYRNLRVLNELHPHLFKQIHVSASALRQMVDTLIDTFDKSMSKACTQISTNRPRSNSEIHQRDLLRITRSLNNQHFKEIVASLYTALTDWHQHSISGSRLNQPIFIAGLIYALHVGSDSKYCRTFLSDPSKRDMQRLEEVKIWIEEEMLDEVWLESLTRQLAWAFTQLRTTNTC